MTKSREEFEYWLKRSSPEANLTRNDNNYLQISTQRLWQAWCRQNVPEPLHNCHKLYPDPNGYDIVSLKNGLWIEVGRKCVVLCGDDIEPTLLHIPCEEYLYYDSKCVIREGEFKDVSIMLPEGVELPEFTVGLSMSGKNEQGTQFTLVRTK